VSRAVLVVAAAVAVVTAVIAVVATCWMAAVAADAACAMTCVYSHHHMGGCRAPRLGIWGWMNGGCGGMGGAAVLWGRVVPALAGSVDISRCVRRQEGQGM